MAWESILTIMVLKGSNTLKKIVKNSQKQFLKGQQQSKRSIQSKAVQTVKIGQNGQWRSKAANTVKNGEKRSKMVKNGEKNCEQGQNRLTTVKTGQYGQNWF